MTREAIKGSHPQALLKTAESSDVHQLVKKKRNHRNKTSRQGKQNKTDPPIPPFRSRSASTTAVSCRIALQPEISVISSSLRIRLRAGQARFPPLSRVRVPPQGMRAGSFLTCDQAGFFLKERRKRPTFQLLYFSTGVSSAYFLAVFGCRETDVTDFFEV